MRLRINLSTLLQPLWNGAATEATTPRRLCAKRLCNCSGMTTCPTRTSHDIQLTRNPLPINTYRVHPIRDILYRVITTRAAWPILICVALLCAMSLGALDVISPERFAKQQVWLLVGAGVILVT